jgi:hypothetical protein
VGLIKSLKISLSKKNAGSFIIENDLRPEWDCSSKRGLFLPEICGGNGFSGHEIPYSINYLNNREA